MTRCALVLLAAGTLAAATPRLHAQATPPAPSANPQAVVTRADLALAYLAFDRALTEHPPAADKLGPLSQGFDQSTLAFFGGKNAEAVRGIHAVTAELLAPGAAATVSPLAIRATVEPHVYRRTLGGPVTLRVVPLYPFADSAGSAPTRFGVRLVSDGGRILAGATVSVAAAAPVGVPIDLPLPDVSSSTPKGRYRVVVTVAPPGAPEPAAPSPAAVPASEWFVTDDDLEKKREEFLRRAASLDSLDSLDSPVLADAAATLKARIRTLTTRPSPANTTTWRANPLTLAAELEFEVQTLTNGADPYTNRSGSLWRVLRTPSRVIPLRTYVPVAVAREKTPAPLLIAIHGVGGDENMFPDALGAGLIVKLAERHGFVVASPNGDLFTTPEDFDRLVEQMAEQVPVDKRRIWIIGHSRGAGQALALARAHGTQIAGVVAIAGLGRVTADASLPPILAFLGELDPLAAPARMLPLAELAKAAGVDIEARVMPKLGHTTVVSAVLVDAVAWLLPRTLPPPAPERR